MRTAFTNKAQILYAVRRLTMQKNWTILPS